MNVRAAAEKIIGHWIYQRRGQAIVREDDAPSLARELERWSVLAADPDRVEREIRLLEETNRKLDLLATALGFEWATPAAGWRKKGRAS